MKVNALVALAFLLCATASAAQETRSAQPSMAAPATSAAATTGVTPPADYVIGPEDVLSVLVWREDDLTAEVVVRPDGKVSLPLLNDVPAAGLTPEEFRLRVTEAARRYVETPSVSVIVKEINSRKVYITGEVLKPGTYPLGGPTTVLQLIAEAGGLAEYADSKNISIMRNEGGKVSTLKFNYREVSKGRRLEQNILLKPGDTVIVP